MKVVSGREEGRDTGRGPSGQFTGTVWLEPMLDTPEGRSNYVVFEPGARTHWHRHSGLQVLYVVAGEGAVETKDGARAVIHAGDVVYFPAGETHWHGAGPSTLMAHIALTLGENEWLEEVSDDQYRARF